MPFPRPWLQYRNGQINKEKLKEYYKECKDCLKCKI